MKRLLLILGILFGYSLFTHLRYRWVGYNALFGAQSENQPFVRMAFAKFCWGILSRFEVRWTHNQNYWRF